MSACVCEQESDYVVQGSPEALKLVEFQILMLNHPLRRIAEVALEFFIRIQYIPMDKRHQSLKGDVYVPVIQTILTRQVCKVGFICTKMFLSVRQ